MRFKAARKLSKTACEHGYPTILEDLLDASVESIVTTEALLDGLDAARTSGKDVKLTVTIRVEEVG